MKNLNKLWVLFLGVIFIACDEEQTDPVITVTPPATYAFERNGATTVSYGGQSSRLEMAGELSVWLNTPTKTKTELVNMFDNGAGFGNPALAASGKKLGNKTAASSQASSTVKPQFDAMIDDVTSNVFPNVANDASEGTPGTYTDPDGGRTVIINGKGHEINQIFTKGLMGALVCDQIIWGYLTAGKLDAGTNKADNDAGTVVDGKNYTQMEHYWDEGFGYLYGLDTDISNSSIEGQDVLVSKYLKKVDGSSLPGIAQELYDAFKHGRAAIVAGAYDIRDEQAEIVKTKLSHIIGRKAADYLRSGAGKINDGKWADAHHALSEGWGFILSLQFTKNPTSGAPYYSNSEVNDMLTQIDNFWTVTPANLETMAAGIETKFGF
ncbi:MAG: DUF4856 domain-containing protein [Cytophagia bacterium]|jgi:hypothetical protein|nr:DUF4856 domain-containing protein [Cytophagia bacterium]|tara:strand:+ start:2866 stop:4005 length:1140 start_codon:yes stop_codon:yes gene_type:complete